jgi:uncharacterized protein (DUF3084 family)
MSRSEVSVIVMHERERERLLAEAEAARQKKIEAEKALFQDIDTKRKQLEARIRERQAEEARQLNATHDYSSAASTLAVSREARDQQLQQEMQQMQSGVDQIEAQLRAHQTELAKSEERLKQLETLDAGTFAILEALNSALQKWGSMEVAQIHEQNGQWYARYEHEDETRTVDVVLDAHADKSERRITLKVEEGFSGDQCVHLLSHIRSEVDAQGIIFDPRGKVHESPSDISVNTDARSRQTSGG